MYLTLESGGVGGVGDCTRPVPTLSNPRESSGPRIDRIPPTRPPWRRRQFRELKKLFFLAPSTCPIDLFGPLANRTVLKRLHDAFAPVLHASVFTAPLASLVSTLEGSAVAAACPVGALGHISRPSLRRLSTTGPLPALRARWGTLELLSCYTLT